MGESVGEIETLELMAPFLPKTVVNELCSGRKWEDYRQRKLELLRWRIARAWWRQRRLGEREREKETRFVDGIGQRKAVVDEELVAFTRAKYGRLAFHDPDHLNYILREHPELRVPTPKPRYLVLNGLRDSRKTPSAMDPRGAGNGARANPATAVNGASRQTGAVRLETGSAHEIPAPQHGKELTYESTS